MAFPCPRRAPKVSSSKSAQPNQQARGTAKSGAPEPPPASQKSVDPMIEQLRENTCEHILDIVDRVWAQKDRFIRWPEKNAPPFMPGVIRDKKYHKCSQEQKQRLRKANIKADGRSNGPAVVAFLLAGGERPKREQSNKRWSVHHIYDGKFPAPGRSKTTWAVRDGDYFTKAAGLVAIHPIADGLADEVSLFAWLLRREAFERFEFDPDGVFRG